MRLAPIRASMHIACGLVGTSIAAAPALDVRFGDRSIQIPRASLVVDGRGTVVAAPGIALPAPDGGGLATTPDSLLGPFVLDAKRAGAPRIPRGARMVHHPDLFGPPPSLILEERRVLEFRPQFRCVSDSGAWRRLESDDSARPTETCFAAAVFCLPGTAPLALRNADTALWADACFDRSGLLRSGTLASPLRQEIRDLPLCLLRDPGSAVDDGQFLSHPAEVRLAPCRDARFEDRPPADRDLSWRDDRDRALDSRRPLPWPRSDSLELRTRAGWLDQGWRIRADGSAAILWVVLAGTRDTLRPSGPDLGVGSLFRPGWIPDDSAFPLPEGWSRGRHPVAFQAAFGSVAAHPAWQDLSWTRRGRTWKADDVRIPESPPGPGAIPSDAPSRVRWRSTPPLFATGSTRRIEGVGTVAWTGASTWASRDTLLAEARLLPTARPRRSSRPGTTLLSIPVVLVRSGERDSAVVVPRPPIRRSSPLEPSR